MFVNNVIYFEQLCAHLISVGGGSQKTSCNFSGAPLDPKMRNWHRQVSGENVLRNIFPPQFIPTCQLRIALMSITYYLFSDLVIIPINLHLGDIWMTANFKIWGIQFYQSLRYTKAVKSKYLNLNDIIILVALFFTNMRIRLHIYLILLKFLDKHLIFHLYTTNNNPLPANH